MQIIKDMLIGVLLFTSVAYASYSVPNGSITGAKLNSNVVDNSTLQYSSSQLSIKASGVGTTQLASGAVTITKLAAPTYAVSSVFSPSTSSTTPQAISASSVTITAAGRPVVVTLAPQLTTGGTVQSILCNSSTSDWVRLDLYRNGSWILRTSASGLTCGGTGIGIPLGATFFDYSNPTGSTTYELYISSGNGAGTSSIVLGVLVAYSL